MKKNTRKRVDNTTTENNEMMVNETSFKLNQVYFGDCLEGMKNIPDKSINFICTDLPYGTTNCNWDEIIDPDELWRQFNRIIAPDGTIALFCLEPFSTLMKSKNIENLRYEYIWDKLRGANYRSVKYAPLKNFETISIFKSPECGKTGSIIYNPQGIVEVNKKAHDSGTSYMGRERTEKKEYIQQYTNWPQAILTFPKDRNNIHYTQKPVALIEYLIKTFSLPGGIVLDACMGSFTTAIAALNSGRKFIGFEKDRTNYINGQTRLANYLLNGISTSFETAQIDYMENNYDILAEKNGWDSISVIEDIEDDFEDYTPQNLELELELGAAI